MMFGPHSPLASELLRGLLGDAATRLGCHPALLAWELANECAATAPARRLAPGFAPPLISAHSP